MCGRVERIGKKRYMDWCMVASVIEAHTVRPGQCRAASATTSRPLPAVRSRANPPVGMDGPGLRNGHGRYRIWVDLILRRGEYRL